MKKILQRVKTYLTSARVVNTAKAAGRVWGMTFLGVFVPAALGWLHDLTDWANAHGQTPFPSLSALTYVGVAAIASSSTALVTILWRAIENATGKGILRDVTFSKELEAVADEQKRTA